MNEALRAALERHYYSDEYQGQGDDMETKTAIKNYYDRLAPLKEKDREMFYAIEDLIADTEIAHGKQGFMRGYEYALTMLGLNEKAARG